MTHRQLAGTAPIIVYYVAGVLGHLEVSLWLVRRRESALLGGYRLADFLPHAGLALLAAVAVWQIGRARRGRNHGVTLAAWAAWAVAVVIADRFLVFSFPEYLHYPQYAVLAFLIARMVDPDRSALAIGPVLLAVTVLGIADEALQYAWITTSYSNYLDFNDFLLNLLGGAGGLLLYYGFTSTDRTRARKAGVNAGRAVTGFCLTGIAMLLLVGAWKAASVDSNLLQPIERQPSYNTWIPGPRAGRYYVLDPVSGTLILTGLGIFISAAPLARQRKTKPVQAAI